MFRFIHAADIHLDSPLVGLERYEGAPRENLRLATRRAMENLVALAIEQSVAFVVIAGDLYDGDWKDFGTGLFFVKQMGRLREAGIGVFVVAGNHDAANRMTRKLRLPDNVRLLSHTKPETVILERLGVAIHGQSFSRHAVQENLAAQYPAAVPGMFNLGLLHTSVTGREGHEPYAPCTLDDLRAKRYDYWALGHVHKQEILSDDPPIVFSGNLQGRHIRETGPKGCMLVSVGDRHEVRVEPRWLDVLRWQISRIDASGVESPYDLLECVRRRFDELEKQADGRALAVRVHVEGACPAHRELCTEPNRWTNQLRAVAQDASGDLWVEKISLATSPPRDGVLPADGPVGELLQYLSQLKSSPDELLTLAGEVKDLRDKLPAELTEGENSLGLDRPEKVRELLGHVEQTLVHLLLSREGAK